MEADVREIWEVLLGRSDFSEDDHFFAVGGTSLGLVEMAYMLWERFGEEFSLESLFGDPTVRGIAKLLMASSNVSVMGKDEPVDGRSAPLESK